MSAGLSGHSTARGSDGSRLSRSYDSVYCWVCGAHPHLLPWHFQWLGVKDLHRDLRRILSTLEGAVLDVGCGDKPYALWLSSAEEHIGIDIVAGPKVDHLLFADKPWPFDDCRFDAIVCTQVLQYVGNPSLFIAEMIRVLRPGGTIVLSVPFNYNEHNVISDYWRYSGTGLTKLFVGLEIVETRRQGGFGSVVGMLTLNWLDSMFNLNKATRLLKGALLPGWVCVSAAINLFGWVLDRLDRTGRFYVNAMIVARRL